MGKHSQESKNKAMIESAKRHDMAGMKKALREGADIDGLSQDGNGMTPLMWAMAMSHVGAVPPEQWAKQLEAIEWLAGRSDVNAVDKDGDTALIIAAKRADADSMRMLLADPRVNVDHEGVHGCALKMVAGRNPACEAMLGERVDLSARDAKGLGPLDWARAKKAEALTELLLYRLAKAQSDELASTLGNGSQASGVVHRL